MSTRECIIEEAQRDRIQQEFRHWLREHKRDAMTHDLHMAIKAMWDISESEFLELHEQLCPEMRKAYWEEFEDAGR